MLGYDERNKVGVGRLYNDRKTSLNAEKPALQWLPS
jgi:hypothetical protein